MIAYGGIAHSAGKIGVPPARRRYKKPRGLGGLAIMPVSLTAHEPHVERKTQASRDLYSEDAYRPELMLGSRQENLVHGHALQHELRRGRHRSQDEVTPHSCNTMPGISTSFFDALTC